MTPQDEEVIKANDASVKDMEVCAVNNKCWILNINNFIVLITD